VDCYRLNQAFLENGGDELFELLLIGNRARLGGITLELI